MQAHNGRSLMPGIGLFEHPLRTPTSPTTIGPEMGLTLHHAGLGEHPPRSFVFRDADADFAVAHLPTSFHSPSTEQKNSSQQPIPPNGFHSTQTTSL